MPGNMRVIPHLRVIPTPGQGRIFSRPNPFRQEASAASPRVAGAFSLSSIVVYNETDPTTGHNCHLLDR